MLDSTGTPRPALYEFYYDPVTSSRVKVLAICETHIVCDGERVFDRQTFATRFMTYTNPSLGIYDGRISAPMCEDCD